MNKAETKLENEMTIQQANKIIDRHPARNVTALYDIYKDDSIDKSHWSEYLWNICYAMDFVIGFQMKISW